MSSILAPFKEIEPEASFVSIEILGTTLLSSVEAVLSTPTIPESVFDGRGIFEVSVLSLTIFC